MSRHALIVPVPELGPVVEPWLERSARSKPSHGVPAHVTLLFPCPGDAEAIRDVLEPFAGFEVEFRETRRFPDVLYLAPEPGRPFVEMTEALVARFPEWPPYEGRFDEIVPHLSIAAGDAVGEAEADLAPRLPLRDCAREAVLLREAAPERWVPAAGFPL